MFLFFTFFWRNVWSTNKKLHISWGIIRYFVWRNLFQWRWRSNPYFNTFSNDSSFVFQPRKKKKKSKISYHISIFLKKPYVYLRVYANFISYLMYLLQSFPLKCTHKCFLKYLSKSQGFVCLVYFSIANIPYRKLFNLHVYFFVRTWSWCEIYLSYTAFPSM